MKMGCKKKHRSTYCSVEPDLKKGLLVYNDFEIQSDTSFEEQQYSFKEDLLQIKFKKKYLIDVGWYPEFDPNGSFLIQVIQNANREKPLMRVNSKNLNELKKDLQDIINQVDKLQ